MVKNKPRKTRKKSRFPGVSVGDEVNTSLGKKKKVSFNIGGKWFFRMVDPDWRAPGRPLKKAKSMEQRVTEDRKQRSAITGQISEVENGEGNKET